VTSSALLPALCTVGWVVWAYARTRPAASIVSSHPPLESYGPWSYAHFNYSDILTLYRVHHLANHAAPYIHTVIEYPVLTGIFMWCAAWFPGVQGYFVASAVGLGACAVGTVWVLYELSPGRAWVFALSPLLLVYSLLNWDLLAIFLMLLGYRSYRRGRFGWAGLFFSLGVFAKFFPFMLFVYCLVELVAKRRDPASWRAAKQMVGVAVVTGVVVNVPFVIGNYRVWANFFSFNASRGGGDGLLYQLHLVSNWPIAAVDALSAVIVLAAMALFARAVLRGSPAAFAAAGAFAVFMLLNKVFSPQYMLWVFVYAVIASWPGWSLASMTVAGLMDFADAMIILHMVAVHAAEFPWYFHTVFPLDKLVRVAAISTGLAGSLWSAARWTRRRRGGGDTEDGVLADRHGATAVPGARAPSAAGAPVALPGSGA